MLNSFTDQINNSMKVFKIIATLLLMPALAFAGGDEDWSVAKISPALIKNANAVLRYEETIFQIKSTKSAVQKYHYVITILNENGDRWAEFTEWYDKMRSLSSIEGRLYDAWGKQLKKVKGKEMQDLSAMDDNSLADDNRMKRHNFYYKVYPYTVEYEVEIDMESTLFFPAWTPQGGEKLSVEKSIFSVVCPKDYQFRYKQFLYNGNPVVIEDKNDRTTTWEAKDMTAILLEPFSPMLHDMTTTVIFGPTEFQVDDYKGNMQTWADFGKFVYALKSGRDELPPEVKIKVHQLTDAIIDPKEKARVLYEYMQQNTRYISIQLGIGGWQPFDAKYVATKKYGDCKALTNYMYSLLKEAGVRSCYTLVRAGENATYITHDFPSQQFNHVILSIPLPKDTMWLECTSQTMPAGYLGDFTCNRYALMIEEDGGHLIRTPSYKLNDNLQIRKINATLKDDASLQIKSVTDYKGLEQDDLFGMIHYLQKDKQKEYLAKRFDLSTYDVDAFDYKELNASMPVLTETLDIYASNYASITGKRLFIIPNVLSRSPAKLKVDDTRKYNVVLKAEYRDMDTVEITIPAGYEAESVPQPVKIETKFGKYTNNATLKGNKIIYYRMMERYSGEFPPAAYADLVSFYDAIYKADRAKLVLVKKEEDKKAF